MGKQIAPDLRGKGISSTKVSKTGEPKHAGNWSAETIRRQSLQSKDYHVRLVDGELIVGDHTPLVCVLPRAVNELALTDPTFTMYQAEWHHTHGVKKYDAIKTLTRRKIHKWYDEDDYEFTYREMIYTENDFKYVFPEY